MSGRLSSELRAPVRMPEIDPAKPAVAGMLKVLARTHQKQAATFRPPVGLRMRQIAYPSKDGSEINAFVIEAEAETAPLPGMLMLHGGAFYLPVQAGTLALACEYASRARIRVFADYRLTPSCPAPKALEDCMALWQKMCASGPELGLDGFRLVVCGDSAGAALAAGLCILLRDAGLPQPKRQLLIYPALDDRDERYGSAAEYDGVVWSVKDTRAMWSAYLNGVDESLLPVLVPLRCEDLRGLPSAYVEPQEIDLLRDQGVAYAKALEAAGVNVEMNIVEDSYHGFDSDLASPLVQRVLARRIAVLERQ